MENIKQIKVNEKLHDIEDAQARADIASEVVNRTNADNALQEKINTNKNNIGELKGDLDEVDNKIESDIYPSKTKIVNAEYASGPAINVFFIPYSDTIKKDTEVVLYFKGYASKEVKVVSCNGTKVGSIGNAKTYNVDKNGYFTIIPEYDKGYANAEYVRVLCFGYNPSTEDWIYEIKNKNGILKRLDDLEYTLEKSINDIDSNIYSVKNGINDMTDKKIAQSSSEGLKILMMSDIHLGVDLQTSLEARWGYTDEERMNELVKVILNEYEQGQIDFILFLGDQVSNQFESTSTSHKDEDFLPLFIKKIKELQIPFYCTMGNHELYDETKWMELFGYPSNYIIEIKGLSIIVLNTFTDTDVTNASSTGYKFADISTDLKNNLLLYLNNTVNEKAILCAHYLYNATSMDNIKSVLAHEKVLAGFVGHNHNLGEISVDGKTIYNDGNFSVDQVMGQKWSYRIFEYSKDYIGTYAVTPSEKYIVDGQEIITEKTVSHENTWLDTRTDFGIKIIKM